MHHQPLTPPTSGRHRALHLPHLACTHTESGTRGAVVLRGRQIWALLRSLWVGGSRLVPLGAVVAAACRTSQLPWPLSLGRCVVGMPNGGVLDQNWAIVGIWVAHVGNERSGHGPWDLWGAWDAAGASGSRLASPRADHRALRPLRWPFWLQGAVCAKTVR